MMRKLLITGMGGFIGSHLAMILGEQPLSNYEIVSWDKQAMGDLLLKRDRDEALNLLRPHAVLHLAWSSTGTDDYHDDPLNAIWGEESSSFLQECVLRKIRFVAMGSAVDLPEDTLLNSPYSAAKQRFRLAFEVLNESGDALWLRPQYVVSLEDKRPRVVREYFDKRLESSFKIVNPELKLDFIHVADVAAAIRIAIEHGITGVAELGSGSLHSVAELVAAAEEWISNSAVTSHNCPPTISASTESTVFTKHGWRPEHTHALFANSST